MGYFSILQSVKNEVRFEYVPWKNVRFFFTLVIKLRKFDFRIHWNALIFFYKKLTSYLNMSCQTVSDLVQASLFGFNFSNKLRNTNLKLYWNNLISIKESLVRSKLVPGFFCLICAFGIITIEIVSNLKGS